MQYNGKMKVYFGSNQLNDNDNDNDNETYLFDHTSTNSKI